MDLKSVENLFKGKNMLLVFLMILIVIVIIDCNTKMFSNMLKNVEGQNGENNGENNVNNCGSGYTNPQQNPSKSAGENCDVAQVNKGFTNNKNNSNNNNNSNNTVKGSPNGYVEDEVLFASATKPLGPSVPKTMQQDYSVLKGFGLVKMPDVINYIPGPGPQEFVKCPKCGQAVCTCGKDVDVNNNNNVNANVNNNGNDNANKNVDVRMYYAPWCGHSKKSRPEMEKFINKHDNTDVDGVKVNGTIVNSEDNKDEVKKQDINGFPTFKAHLFENGKELTNYVLELPERTLEALENALKEALNKIKSL